MTLYSHDSEHPSGRYLNGIPILLNATALESAVNENWNAYWFLSVADAREKFEDCLW